MKFIQDVHCSDEFCDHAPDILVVEIHPERAQWIRDMAAEVRRLGAYAIGFFDYSPTWYERDWDQETDAPVPGEEFTGLDLNTLHVSDDDFWWEANLKGSSVSVQSEPILISELPE